MADSIQMVLTYLCTVLESRELAPFLADFDDVGADRAAELMFDRICGWALNLQTGNGWVPTAFRNAEHHDDMSPTFMEILLDPNARAFLMAFLRDLMRRRGNRDPKGEAAV